MKSMFLKSMFSAMIVSSISVMIGCTQMAGTESDAVEEPTEAVSQENVAESSEAIGQCGVGLYCYWTAYKGTSACLNNNQTVHCCPLGFASAGGSCVPICGSGLSCGYSSLWPSGSNVCTQNNGNQNPVYCCAPGKTFTPNGCL